MEYTAHELMFTVHPLHPHYHYEARVRAETISPGPYTSGSVQAQLNEAGMPFRKESDVALQTACMASDDCSFRKECLQTVWLDVIATALD